MNARRTKKGIRELTTTPVECHVPPPKPPANARATKIGTQQPAPCAESAFHADKPSPSSYNTRISARAGKGSIGDTPELPVAHPRGRGRVLPRTLEAVDKEMGAKLSKDAGVIDSPIAAAASTLVYQLAYGDGSASYDDQEDEEVDDHLSNLDYSVPEGLVFSDDEDALRIEPDSDNMLFWSLFPKDTSRTKNFVLGGPQPPDLSNYPKGERQEVWLAYKKKRKAYNDKEPYKRAKMAQESGLNATVYSGCNNDQLRMMNNVKSGLLLVGHSFSTKDILHLRVAEEANLQGIVMKVCRSNDQNFTASGVNFYVRATFTKMVGWTVHLAKCREGDDVLQIPPKF